jgi:hypothetical protein
LALRIAGAILAAMGGGYEDGFRPGPANTMSRGGTLATSMMLTLSERWLTTHTSPSLRAATATEP